MKKYIPHLCYFGVIFAIIIIGVATNSREIARFAGTLTGLSIDPIIIIGGLLIGFLIKGQQKIIAAALVLGIVASVIITVINSSSFSLFILILRCLATLAWAYIANIIVLAKS